MADDGDNVTERMGREIGRQLVTLTTYRDQSFGQRPDAFLCARVAPGATAEATEAPYEPGQVGLSRDAIIVSGHGAVRLGTIRPTGSCRR
jgi:hypothetical protein